MSISAIESLRYQPPLSNKASVFFELSKIQMEKSCVANQSHRSEYYEIFFIEEGNGTYQIDFNEFSINGAGIFCLSPGQVLVVESETMKSGFQLSFNREFYCVETHGKEIACNGVLFNNVHRATAIPLTQDERFPFQQSIQSMIRELENPGKAHRDILETYLRMFLIEALRKYDEKMGSPSVEIDESNRLAGDFIALVDKHFRTLHAVSDYAEQLFVSPKSISKRLNAYGYPTPTEVIRNRIVLEAKRELRYTQKSVKEIAFELGFEDPAYFTRYFKKAAGTSPANYRTSYLE